MGRGCATDRDSESEKAFDATRRRNFTRVIWKARPKRIERGRSVSRKGGGGRKTRSSIYDDDVLAIRSIESVEFTRCAPCTRAVHEKLGKRKSSGRWKEKWRWRTGVVPCSVLGVLKCVVLVISRKMILFWRDILSWLWKNVFVQRDSWLQRIWVEYVCTELISVGLVFLRSYFNQFKIRK